MNALAARLESARKELLDLGLRNSLINFRTRAKKIDVVDELSSEVFRLLVREGKKMRFLPLLDREGNGDGSDALAEVLSDPDPDFTKLFGEDDELGADGLAARHTDENLQTRLETTRLHARLLQLSNEARTYIEEQGLNILYLALGFLHWYESDSSETARRAPLLLVPVELKRGAATERFAVSYSDEDVQDNLSLLEKMRLEFGIKLPSIDDSEDLNVSEFMADVEEAIKNQSRWRVQRDEIVLGFFSFGKLLMYQDLDPAGWPTQGGLAGMSIITALLEDGFTEPASGIPDEGSLDDFVDITQLNQIVDADSTQTSAVLDAISGRNLVIQGPPGTGKSQTITNIIAEAIGAGKSVLFVSEKMAALEVVKRRLDNVGLGDAALELHSHKTNKKAVLEELNRTLQLGRPVRTQNEAEISSLAALRDRLNAYATAINEKILESGLSPIAAIGRYERLGQEAKQATRLDFSQIRDWTEAHWHQHRLRVQELDRRFRVCGTPSKHPFWGARVLALLPTDERALSESISKAKEATVNLVAAASKLASSMGLRTPRGYAEIDLLSRAAVRASQAPHLKGVVLSSDDWQIRRDDIRKLIGHGRSLSGLRHQYGEALLLQAWDEGILQERQALRDHRKSWIRWFLPSFRNAKNRLRSLYKIEAPKSVDDLLTAADAILNWQSVSAEFDDMSTLGSSLFGAQWQGIDSDWDVLEQILDWTIELYNEVGSGQLPKGLIDFLEGGPEAIHFEPAVDELKKIADSQRMALTDLLDTLQFDVSLAHSAGEPVRGLDNFHTLSEALERWANGIPRLRDLVGFNAIASECVEEGLGFVVNAATNWPIEGPTLVNALDVTWYEGLLREAFQSRPPLMRFDRTGHEVAIKQFRDLDMKHLEMRRQVLAASHWESLPSHHDVGEMRTVRQEINKKRRHLPIRQLMAKAGRAIQAVKPVFMMSPMSIAKFLAPGSVSFDIVVFDEASQVRPVDALGALARGSQAIVVGDHKQLPPTSFFDTLYEGDEAQDDEVPVGDLESILNLFVAQGAPQRMLQWHYRSRHHSLIAVSNAEFYDSRLTIFPASGFSRCPLGLRFHHLPDTIYDRGRSRTNPAEARRVAEAVVHHAKANPDMTLGVVTFSSAQRDAVMFQIEYLRRKDPSTEDFFAGHPEEPFFVKNLENVQGDERDVIYISVGYGKSDKGYLAHSFGPLNQDGGERRLNVLITRARYACEVFANFEAEDIDLARTNAAGVVALKKFLAYAKTGIMDIGVATGGDADSPFEEEVEAALLSLGLNVERQVGVGGFRIDLSVKDPDRPGRYLLGIECDGATYHSARWARDRDRLRQQVLEGLGWRIHRIWSTDWYRDRAREVRRVAEALELAKAHFEAIARGEAERVKEAATARSTEIVRESVARNEEATATSIAYKQIELELDLGDTPLHELPLEKVVHLCETVVDVEGPIHMDLVFRRIAEGAGIKRVGSRIRNHLSSGVDYAVRRKTLSRNSEFLAVPGRTLEAPRDRSELAGSMRNLDWVPGEEIRLALIAVVRAGYSISEEEACKEALSRLGLQRLTAPGKERMEAELIALVKDGDIERVGERLQPLKS
jgi:very-short-patch-repair endonuclease